MQAKTRLFSSPWGGSTYVYQGLDVLTVTMVFPLKPETLSSDGMQSLPIGPDDELPTSARQSSNAFTHPKQCLAALCYATLKAKSTKQVTAGTKERDCSLTYWQQTSLIVLSASKSLPKAWQAAGCEGRGWKFDGTIIMPWPLL